MSNARNLICKLLLLVVCTRFVRRLVGRSHFTSLVACYATLHPSLSVRPSVRLSVGLSHFTFLGVWRSFTSPLLPKRSGDLNYGPCPSARDFDSRVSGLVSFTGSCNHCPFPLPRLKLPCIRPLVMVTKTPDTRLPQLLAGGQGPYFRLVEHAQKPH